MNLQLQKQPHISFTGKGFTAFLLAIHCAATPPNLVISDIIMPHMSGFDLANRLRNTHPQCKILLSTGQAGVDDLREYALELGHDIEVLSKPLHPLKLIERVKIISGDQISSGQ
ncbi:CheY-like chemotaxis protein [Granulicella aggregans]|uniref:CheY-like chemotaxis protein n=1 Tax=Granulicella aggregans TaxID=474949 RepID=A0A7W7ZJ83_9BACT|nr:CheY-like chemotaxis protein [Granulicella aggregans]